MDSFHKSCMASELSDIGIYGRDGGEGWRDGGMREREAVCIYRGVGSRRRENREDSGEEKEESREREGKYTLTCLSVCLHNAGLSSIGCGQRLDRWFVCRFSTALSYICSPFQPALQRPL